MAGRVRAAMADRRRGRARGGRVLEPWPLRHSLVVFLVGAGAALGVFAVVYRATDGDMTRDRVDVAIKAAAAIAAVAAGLLTWARLELSRHEHRLGVDRDLTERYSRSIEQVGSEDTFVRLGGIYALERVALDAARRDDSSWRMALDVLATLARELSAEARKTAPDADGDEAPPPETPLAVVEAVRVLARFAERSGIEPVGAAVVEPEQVLYVGGSATAHDLAGVILRGADLGNRLEGVDLIGARLVNADLTGADLSFADLRGADLRRATLAEARLDLAVLNGAELHGADLSGAQLADASLDHAEFDGADLRGALLLMATLREARLAGADLREAVLEGADLTGVRYDESTLWPEEFDPPPSAAGPFRATRRRSGRWGPDPGVR